MLAAEAAALAAAVIATPALGTTTTGTTATATSMTGIRDLDDGDNNEEVEDGKRRRATTMRAVSVVAGC